MNYQTVVDEIGGGSVSETARKLRWPFSTVNAWRLKGTIPHWRQSHIRAVALLNGVNVDKDLTKKREIEEAQADYMCWQSKALRAELNAKRVD